MDCWSLLQEPVKVPLVDQGVLDRSAATGVFDRSAATDAFNAAVLAKQNAALAVENARLQHENMLMHLRSQAMTRMAYAPPGLFECMDPLEITHVDSQLCMYQSRRKTIENNRKALKNVGSQKASDVNSNAPSLTSKSTASGDLSSFNSSLQSSDVSDIDEDRMGVSASASPRVETTVMLRNLPNNMTCEQLLQLINDQDFEGRYNLVYLPVDFKTKVGLGYAFVDMRSNEDAKAFFDLFDGFDKWTMRSEKVCGVSWSAMQGVEEHVERYRNSPVMHESVPDEFRPLLYKDGVRIPFPEPTKRIRAPRQWSRRHSTQA